MSVGTLLLLPGFLALVVAPSLTPTRNPLLNPHFDQNLAGWTTSGSGTTPAWTANDSGGNTRSGSVTLKNTSAAARTSGGISQCVPVSVGTDYVASFKALLPNNPSSGNMGLSLAFYPSTNCSGTALWSTSGGLMPPAPDTWVSFQLPSIVPPTGSLTVSVLAYVYKDDAGSAFSGQVDDVSLTPSVVTLTIPASASIQGVPPTFWHTDLWIVNLSDSHYANLTLRHRCLLTQVCGSAEKSFIVSPLRSALFWDVVGSFFHDPDSSGAIEVTYNASVDRIVVGSRTYTPTSAYPTYGTAVPALPPDAAKTKAVFWGLANHGGDSTDGFRSNAGAYNPWDASVDMTFTLYDANGTIAGSPWTRTFSAHEPFQVDVFRVTGNTAVVARDYYLVMTATAPVFGYVTVVDNHTGDTTWVDAADFP
jgi:hypothetical protein